MTLVSVSIDELPAINQFLLSNSPGIKQLDDNIIFSQASTPSSNREVSWPLSSQGSKKSYMKLEDTYINIARPPLNDGNFSYESTTYVSLPNHIHKLFESVIEHKTENKSLDGGVQIGSNFTSMLPDPFHLVNLNPGCLSAVIELNNSRNHLIDDVSSQSKNPFAKFTTNFNKFLKITLPSEKEQGLNYDNFQPLMPCFKNSNSNSNGYGNGNGIGNGNGNGNGNGSNGNGNCNSSGSSSGGLFYKLLNQFDLETYMRDLSNPDTSKLLISCHVDVINIFALDIDSRFKSVKKITSDKPYNNLLFETNGSSYEKHIPEPLLRFQLRPGTIVTSFYSFKHIEIPMILLGLNSGEIVLFNLKTLTFQLFENFAGPATVTDSFSMSPQNVSSTLTNVPVTSLEAINHPVYDFVILGGFANGEFIILNPFAVENTVKTKYSKSVVDKDQFVTYFKKFDLTPFSAKTPTVTDSNCPSCIMGHVKLSQRPITCINSTISLTNTNTSNLNPMLIAAGSDDGIVRLISLTDTYNEDYGSNNRTTPKSVVSDMISNYFHDGITDIKFSPDFKFLCVVGNGDIVEIFKLGYYNVNGLLGKHHSGTNSGNVAGRRSRSGTVNSSTSNNLGGFLSPQATSQSNSLDVPRNEDSGTTSDALGVLPPALKEIRLVVRLKGHTNRVSRVLFITNDQIFNPNLETSNESDLIYRIMSSGKDGKAIVWEFDYKALPKVRVPRPKRKVPTNHQQDQNHLQSQNQPQTTNNKSKLSSNQNPPPISTRGIIQHGRTKSNQLEDSNTTNRGGGTFPSLNASLGISNLNSVLSKSKPGDSNNNDTSNGISQAESAGDQVKGVAGLYSSLYDVRHRKHYTHLLMEQAPEADSNKIKKYPTIIHPIVNDKLVPSIEVPLTEVDLNFWFKDGKVYDIFLDGIHLWCLGRNGDIIKYSLE